MPTREDSRTAQSAGRRDDPANQWFDALCAELAAEIPVAELKSAFDGFAAQWKAAPSLFRLYVLQPEKQRSLVQLAVAVSYSALLKAVGGADRSLADLRQNSPFVRLVTDGVLADLNRRKAAR